MGAEKRESMGESMNSCVEKSLLFFPLGDGEHLLGESMYLADLVLQGRIDQSMAGKLVFPEKDITDYDHSIRLTATAGHILHLDFCGLKPVFDHLS